MSPPGDGPAVVPGAGWQPVHHIGASRRAGEILSLLGALVLLVAAVALRWYGAAEAGGLERPGASRTLSMWQSLTVTRWLVLATVAATLAAAALRALRGGRGQLPGVAGGLAGLAAVTALGLAYRVLISPPQAERVFDIKLGAALGLLGAVAIAAGSLESWRSARSGARLAAGGHRHGAGQSRLTPAR